jgi:hypothetical protein
MNKPNMTGADCRIIDALLLAVGSGIGFNQTITAEYPVDGGQAGFVFDTLSGKVLVDADGTAKRVLSCRRVSLLKKLSGMNNRSFDICRNLSRLGTRLRRLVEIPCLIITLAAFSPLINPITGTLKNRRNIENGCAFGIQRATFLSNVNFFIGRLTFLFTPGLLVKFSRDINCSRCHDTAMFTML